jgi:hypothetical protein
MGSGSPTPLQKEKFWLSLSAMTALFVIETAASDYRHCTPHSRHTARVRLAITYERSVMVCIYTLLNIYKSVERPNNLGTSIQEFSMMRIY